MAYTSTNWPPLRYPSPTPQKELWTALAPRTPPSQALPSVTPAKVSWQAAAPVPNTTTYLSPTTTQIAIYTQFKIIDRRLTPPDTTLDINGNTIILAPPR